MKYKIGGKSKETKGSINEAKSWFFEKFNQINEPLQRLFRKKKIKKDKEMVKIEIGIEVRE